MQDKQYEELLNKIDKLQKDNDAFLLWQRDMTKVLQQMLDTIEEQKKQIKNAQQYSYVNRIRIESLPYELGDPRYHTDVFIPNMLSRSETRSKIINERKSISRFGDGEFGLIAGVARWNFQSTSDRLAELLTRVLQSDDEGFLVGINPNFYGNVNHMKEEDADGVRAYMRPNVRKLHAQLLNPQKTYADGLMNLLETEDDIRELKQLWDGKDCVFIEGQYTRMGVGNDLYSNSGSIQRILCPAENAIDKYDEIIETVLKQPKDKLILLALGPTASALAYDLYKEGYWAVDIGHIDLYYEQFVREAKLLEDVSIPYKYCSWDEIGERRQIPDVDDDVYKSQIIASIV